MRARRRGGETHRARAAAPCGTARRPPVACPPHSAPRRRPRASLRRRRRQAPLAAPARMPRARRPPVPYGMRWLPAPAAPRAPRRTWRRPRPRWRRRHPAGVASAAAAAARPLAAAARGRSMQRGRPRWRESWRHQRTRGPQSWVPRALCSWCSSRSTTVLRAAQCSATTPALAVPKGLVPSPLLFIFNSARRRDRCSMQLAASAC